jgi:hypothetical protein
MPQSSEYLPEPLLGSKMAYIASSTKDELYKNDVPVTLQAYIESAIRVDNRLFERRAERGTFVTTRPNNFNGSFQPPRQFGTPPVQSDPMEIGTLKFSRNSPEEKERRRKLGLCMYCGKADHKIAECPLLKQKGQTQDPSKKSNVQSA